MVTRLSLITYIHGTKAWFKDVCGVCTCHIDDA